MTTHNLLNQWLVQFVPTMNFGVKEDPQCVYVLGRVSGLKFIMEINEREMNSHIHRSRIT